MKEILTSVEVDIPENVEVKFKNRVVTVKGPLGTLSKDLRHTNFSVCEVKDASKKIKKIKIQLWFSKRKIASLCTTIATHIKNLIRGVTKVSIKQSINQFIQQGYGYRMKFASAHFPIQAKCYSVIDNGKVVEIKNFVGEKYTRRFKCLGDVKCIKTDEAKEELFFKGSNLEEISLTCALIQQNMHVKNKDKRQFLDGIYVSDARLDPAKA